jgi:electron transfer flavoprotein beta subunit
LKILVPIKRVPDPYAIIRLKPDGSGIDEVGLKWEINPFDEIAVEEAVRTKEAGKTQDILVVSVGGRECQEQLRKALAIGADRALLVEHTGPLDPLDAARVLKAVYEKEHPDVVMMGKQAIDDDFNQTGQMLASLLGLPLATFVSKIEWQDGKATVEREVDAGIEVVTIALPAIITTDLRLNEPRYVPLPGIIRARTKPLETIPLAELGVTPQASLKVLSMAAPPGRAAGRKVESVDELVTALREEARVL